MAKKKSDEEDNLHDSLASDLSDALNKKFKKQGIKASYFVDTDKDNPSNIVGWVPTGCDMLDLAISNRPNGGLPMGRIVEIMGLEASGKSLLCAHIIAETQKMGGIAAYIDTEYAMDEVFFDTIGVDFSKLIYSPISELETGFEIIEQIVEKVRSSSKDKPVTIIMDSVMGAKTRQEQEADYGKDGYATSKAIILSKAMRKLTDLIAENKILLIFTNQLRVKMDAMAFGDKYTTSGGKAIGFHSSVRLRIKSMGKITAMVNGVKTVVGMKTQVVVQKNRMGPPHKAINYNIYFDSGIDNVDGWINVLKAYGIITGTAAKFTYNTKDGNKVEFKPATFQDIVLGDETLKQEIYDVLCEKFIMKYNPREGGEVEVVGVDDDDKLMQDIADGLSQDAEQKKGVIEPNTDFLNEKPDEE